MRLGSQLLINDLIGYWGTMDRPSRLPQLTDGPSTGNYRVREGHLPRFGFKLSRADVADFMIKRAEDGTFIGKIVGVCK